MAEQLRIADVAALDAALGALYSMSDPVSFPSRVLCAAGLIVPTEITCYTELEPSAQRAFNVADRPSEALDALIPVLAELQMQHPRIVDYVQNGVQDARCISDYISRAAWHRRDLFQEFYGRFGLEDQMVVMVPISPTIGLAVALNRSSRSFTEIERTLLERIRPHVGLAYANSRAVGLLKGRLDTLSEAVESRHRGAARLGRDGRVRFCTPRGRELLRSYAGWEADSPAPPVIQAWIQAQSESWSDSGSAAYRRVQTFLGAAGRLTLRLIDDPSDDCWMLVLEEVEASDGRGSPIPELPARLRRVYERLVLGESEKEVANRLRLSIHTVHEYTKRIYRAFSVSTRAELLAQVIRRTY